MGSQRHPGPVVDQWALTGGWQAGITSPGMARRPHSEDSSSKEAVNWAVALDVAPEKGNMTAVFYTI